MVCMWGHIFTFKRKTHVYTCAHTRTRPAFHSSLCRPLCFQRLLPLNWPGKRNPHSLPNQATTPPSDSERPRALPTYTCLSAGLSAWEGASPTFLCPSALLTGASKQGTPPSTRFMPISTSDGHRRVGESLEPLSGEGRRISTLGGAWAAQTLTVSVDGLGQTWVPSCSTV